MTTFDSEDTNPLTGLPNRRAFARRLEKAPGIGALVHVNVDGLGWVNRLLGTPSGDQVLRDFASYLNEVVPLGSTVGHWGDEFVVHLCDESKASSVAELLRRVAESLWRRRRAEAQALAAECPDRVGQMLTISAGIAGFDGTAGSLWRASDACMSAKSMGRNRVVSARSSDAGTLAAGERPLSRRPT